MSLSHRIDYSIHHWKCSTVLLGIFIPSLLLSGCSSPKQQKELESSPTPYFALTASPSPIVTVLPSSIQPTVHPTKLPSATPTISPKPTQIPSTNDLRIHQLPSTFHSDEKRNTKNVDTIVIHSLYNPNSTEPFSITACKAVLDQYEVSSHYLIDRSGVVWQLVPETYQAWHAGVSTMPAPDGRTGVNAFSIGVELIANETSGYTDVQYQSVALLSAQIMSRLPISYVVGHSDIASDRKTDPWKFDWSKFETSLKNQTTHSFQILGTH